jgi:hypothetical protein
VDVDGDGLGAEIPVEHLLNCGRHYLDVTLRLGGRELDTLLFRQSNEFHFRPCLIRITSLDMAPTMPNSVEVYLDLHCILHAHVRPQ